MLICIFKLIYVLLLAVFYLGRATLIWLLLDRLIGEKLTRSMLVYGR
jgi:hypothetical protein